MAIKGPKGAEPTTRGWVHAHTGELLKSQRITPAQISEWHGHTAEGHQEPVLQTLHEAPVVEREVTPVEYSYHVEGEGEEEEETSTSNGFRNLW